MSSNATTIEDEDGDNPDWVELYNKGETPINLLGYSISDDAQNLTKWTFPDIEIPTKSFLIIFASGKDRKSTVPLHTNFKIKSSGEDLFLTDKMGTVIDNIKAISIERDFSYGRKPDGSSNFIKFTNPSPEKTNNQNLGYNFIEFSHDAGFYLNNFELTITSSNPEDKIFYTMDGSIPTINSIEYKTPINIKSRIGDENVFSMLRTNPKNAPSGYIWKPPQDEVFKATVIRASSFNNTEMNGNIETHTYFVASDIYSKYSFPIVSLTTDSINLFGFDEGIYVPGKTHAEDSLNAWYWGSGNYHQRGNDWERRVHIEFFETDGTLAFSQDAGCRINGSGGRALSEKSLRLYARNKYGKNTFDYQLFPSKKKNKYKRFLLRNSGQDFLWTMFVDALIQNILINTGIEFQDSRPSIVFINGEYWGIHNIRDRYDEFYLEDYSDVDDDDIEYFDNDLVFDPTLSVHYNNLHSFIENNDMKEQENYKTIEKLLDTDNFINYNIGKMFFAVYDWPGNNVSLWRPNTSVGKWRWLTFDNDDGMMYLELNSIEHAITDTSDDWRNPPWSTFLLNNLMKNDEFRQKFIDTLELRMNSIFRPQKAIKKINEFKAIYELEIDEHIARWNYPESKDFWLENIDRLLDFAQRRPYYMINFIKEKFGVNIKYYDSSNVPYESFEVFPNPNNGSFKFELISSYTGKYQIRVHNIYGKIVFDEKVSDFYFFDKRAVELGNISDGVYFISIMLDARIITKKLLIRN